MYVQVQLRFGRPHDHCHTPHTLQNKRGIQQVLHRPPLLLRTLMLQLSRGKTSSISYLDRISLALLARSRVPTRPTRGIKRMCYLMILLQQQQNMSKTCAVGDLFGDRLRLCGRSEIRLLARIQNSGIELHTQQVLYTSRVVWCARTKTGDAAMTRITCEERAQVGAWSSTAFRHGCQEET